MNQLAAISLSGHRVRVRGAVQGVGFRPAVYHIADHLGLDGWVLNDSDGVLIHVDGGDIDGFVKALRRDSPPLARIDDIALSRVQRENCAGFHIRTSLSGQQAATCITADAAICDACATDICTPSNRRYGYAFTNCTHCGPRYSITRHVPYDRANTSMSGFPMCDACAAEYADPLNRRFHAQPNACPDCGPQLSHSLSDIVAVLAAGGCVAIKGLGGYQLMVDARSEVAVSRLRQIKARDAKPFAVMVPGKTAAKQIAHIDAGAWDAVRDHRRPIVVVRRGDTCDLAPSVTLGLKSVGIMLPTTPLHMLLFHQAVGAPDGIQWCDTVPGPAYVCTSANMAGDPLITDDAAARAAFDGVVDLVVTHDRPIVIPVDDSVVRVTDGAPAVLRRARGFAPDPIDLGFDVPPILALGAELKNTICVTRGHEAFVSQHIGGQRSLACQGLQRDMIRHLLNTLDVDPVLMVTDIHPDMNAGTVAEFSEIPLLRVQHHHAHIASVLAEHQISGPVLGLAFDGFGIGDDGRSNWGGELLMVDGADMHHVAGLQPLKMPGGDAAARDPWRMAAALLHEAGLDPAAHIRGEDGLDMISAMLARGVNTPETSSAGRLFDAVSALLGVHSHNRYEGEAAMRLEDLADNPVSYPGGWKITADGTLSLLPLVPRLLGADPVHGANLFHGTFSAAVADWTQWHAARLQAGPVVALSGGCFQNVVLSEAVRRHLTDAGLTPVFNRKLPANDGGLAVGQAWIAAHHLARNGE